MLTLQDFSGILPQDCGTDRKATFRKKMKLGDHSSVNSTMPGTGWAGRFHAWALSKGNSRYEAMIAARKRALFGSLSGTVLEIGPGAGPNLARYPPGIRWIGIEPNRFLHPYLNRAMEKAQMSGEIRTGTADSMDITAGSVDAVVGTLVLCSVPDVSGVLAEILRILRPGGRYYFIEHVAAPQGTGMRTVQRLSRPFWTRIAGGCHPDRETWLNLEAAGFEELKYERFRLSVPVASPHIAGYGRKKL